MKITHEGVPAPRLYVTDTGGNPVLPDPNDPPPAPDEVDVALDADAFVPIATSDTVSVVQFKNQQAALSGSVVTLDAAPTPGNILVVFYSSRSTSTETEVPGPDGWTAHPDSPVYGGTSIGMDPACPTFAWWHQVETGDGATIDVGTAEGNPSNISAVELAGAPTLIDTPSANQVTDDNPKLTGVVGGNDAVVLVGADVQQDGTPLVYTPDSGTTELYDDSIGGDTWPHQWVGYRIETTPGSYDVGATGLFSLPWGALGFVFDSGGGGIFQQVAPLTVDGDDATYNESSLEEEVRLDIGTAQRLTGSRLLIGFDTSGSKTVHLWASNDPDMAGATEVDSQAFTATGSFTGDEVLFTIADTTAYRYWEFRGPVEDTRTYTVEMFAFQQSFDLSGYQLLSEKDDPNGYAGLTADGQVPDDEIADGSASDGDVPISNGDGTRTWGPMSGGGGTPSDTVSDETTFDLTPDAGAATEYSRGDHTHGSPPTPTGGVTEITDLPTAETDTTKRLAPDGVGGVEWASAGGGGSSMPKVVQSKFDGTGISSMTVTAPVSGHTCFLYVDGFNTADPTAITQTNVTWTKIVSVSAGAKYSLWVGVVSGTGGTTITITHANGFLSAFFLEVEDTLTGTLGTSVSGAHSPVITTPAAPGAGNLVVFADGNDNTTAYGSFYPGLPVVGLPGGIVAIGVAYSQGYPVSMVGRADIGGTMVIAEVT